MADQLTIIAGEVYLGHWHVATLTDKAPPTILERTTWLMEESSDEAESVDSRIEQADDEGYNQGYEDGLAEGKVLADA